MVPVTGRLKASGVDVVYSPADGSEQRASQKLRLSADLGRLHRVLIPSRFYTHIQIGYKD
jgi:hypothetical protein